MNTARSSFKGSTSVTPSTQKSWKSKIGIPYTVITPLIFIFVRACVHYAMFEDEYYLKSQIEVLKQSVLLFLEKYNNQYLKHKDESN